ncbi:SDR family NAD(P)-dependent oxidoreductase [Streptomyces sp. NPDC048825]|uniref:SDR family NAD(P)-dependent oxidoreductase n=1 Tax=Streptomyces sp. NPDC048825 TaxID=3365592 RepID=UPI003711C3FA
MTTTLITGANRGLGLETARQLIEAGHEVYLGARDPMRGAEAVRRVGGRTVQVDVTSDASVVAAAKRIGEEVERLDVLINNAGIFGSRQAAADITAEDMLTVYDTNVFGVVRMTHAFAPLLAASDNPVVVNVSSGLGSIAAAVDPTGYPAEIPVWVPSVSYGSAKAALNMVTVQYAHAYPQMRINTVDPGLTDSDPGQIARPGAQTVTEGAAVIVALASIDKEGPTGGFYGNAGPLPW